MMSTDQRHAAMDDMATHGCLTKALEDVRRAQAVVDRHEKAVATGEVDYDPKARCYKVLKDAQMVLEFQRRNARPFDHVAEAQALAGRNVEGIALNLITGEVLA